MAKTTTLQHNASEPVNAKTRPKLADAGNDQRKGLDGKSRTDDPSSKKIKRKGKTRVAMERVVNED